MRTRPEHAAQVWLDGELVVEAAYTGCPHPVGAFGGQCAGMAKTRRPGSGRAGRLRLEAPLPPSRVCTAALRGSSAARWPLGGAQCRPGASHRRRYSLLLLDHPSRCAPCAECPNCPACALCVPTHACPLRTPRDFVRVVLQLTAATADAPPALRAVHNGLSLFGDEPVPLLLGSA